MIKPEIVKLSDGSDLNGRHILSVVNGFADQVPAAAEYNKIMMLYGMPNNFDVALTQCGIDRGRQNFSEVYKLDGMSCTELLSVSYTLDYFYKGMLEWRRQSSVSEKLPEYLNTISEWTTYSAQLLMMRNPQTQFSVWRDIDPMLHWGTIIYFLQYIAVGIHHKDIEMTLKVLSSKDPEFQDRPMMFICYQQRLFMEWFSQKISSYHESGIIFPYFLVCKEHQIELIKILTNKKERSANELLKAIQRMV